jgi:tetraacyldisaccharide-1-P 4'-kinase
MNYKKKDMNMFYEEEIESLTELERYMLSKSNTKLEKWEMYKDFLEKSFVDEEMMETLSKYDSADITTAWVGLYSKYFNKIKHPKTIKRIYDYEFVQYNKYNLVQLTKDDEVIVMTNKVAVKFSKTAWSKFNKHFNVDDISRVRLYQMFYSHKREDDSFMGILKDEGVFYTPLETMEPIKWLEKYPEICI